MRNLNEWKLALGAARKNLKEVNTGTTMFTGNKFENLGSVVNEMLEFLESVEELQKAAKETLDEGRRQGARMGALDSALNLLDQGGLRAPMSALNEAKARLGGRK